MSNYQGYGSQGSGSGNMNLQPPVPTPPTFQQPKASPSHPGQMGGGGVRNSPSHPSQMQGGVRSSPSHPSSQMGGGVGRSPSHPSSQLTGQTGPGGVRSSPSHSASSMGSTAAAGVGRSPSHGPSTPQGIQGVRNSPSHPSSQHSTIRNSPSHNSTQMNVGSLSSSSSGGIEPDEQQKLRFQIELEFVQSLGNPNYLHFLAQRGYMKDTSFINYLKYLQYWQEPQYVKYLKYPVCLHFLELLQHETFRKEIVNGQCARFLDDQVVLHWQHYSRKRAKMFETAVQGQGGVATAGGGANAAGNGTIQKQ